MTSYDVICAVWLFVMWGLLQPTPLRLVSAFTAAGCGAAGPLGGIAAMLIWLLMEIYYAPEIEP